MLRIPFHVKNEICCVYYVIESPTNESKNFQFEQLKKEDLLDCYVQMGFNLQMPGDSPIDRSKAAIALKGFNQLYSVNYSETIPPATKHKSNYVSPKEIAA
eukprot:TRINITY_DN24312_c0_g1_i1.p1 TRINITY_DN24312_c0_g1~~TRINITY_DN24312_c0_g1_i1.p1  ORF type:complete len:101 (-),score=8.38 TRINITY_DN24312_c0_g1_i1:64-366(-)